MKNFARIENGKVVERIDAYDLPPFHPSLHWEQCPAGTQVGWLFDGSSFSAPSVDVVVVKSVKWADIKAKRDAIKAGGVKVGTKWYHTDTESRIQHLGLLEKARTARAAGGTDATRLQALGQDIKWKTMDGSFIYLTVKHAEDIFAAVTDLDAAAFAAAETHRVAMEASADPAAYDFSVGWPATFAG